MSAKASSLQVENEADDWTQVEDRQERKRIQNRLAQRIYRKNLKQKLETLERLAKTLQPGLVAGIEASHDDLVQRSRSAVNRGSDGAEAYLVTKYLSGSQSTPLAGAGSNSDTCPSESNSKASMLGSIGGLREHKFHGMDMNIDPALQSTFDIENGDLWAGVSNMEMASDSEAALTNIGQLLEAHALDYFSFEKIDHTQKKTAGASQGFMDSVRGMRTDSASSSASSTEDQTDGSRLDLCLPPQSWSGRGRRRGGSDSDTTAEPNSGTDSAMGGSQSSVSSPDESPEPTEKGGDHMQDTTPNSQPEASELNARLSSVLASVKSHGFSSLEDAMVHFLTADLTERPSLAFSQRLSRRRGLAWMLLKVREAASDWSESEAQGWRDGVSQSAEIIFMDEYRRYLATSGGFGSHVEKLHASGELLTLQALFQEELPRLYELLESLCQTADGGKPGISGENSRSDMVVRIIYMIFEASLLQAGSKGGG